MNKLLLLVVIAVAGYFGYGYMSSYIENPMEISDPVYLESRVIFEAPEISRSLEYVLVAEMVSDEDCQMRSEEFLQGLFKNCKPCKIKLSKCSGSLDDRYMKLFSDQPTYTTYFSMNKGNRYERNARMIIWGLTEDEAKTACGIMKKSVKESYTGQLQCIAGRG